MEGIFIWYFFVNAVLFTVIAMILINDHIDSWRKTLGLLVAAPFYWLAFIFEILVMTIGKRVMHSLEPNYVKGVSNRWILNSYFPSRKVVEVFGLSYGKDISTKDYLVVIYKKIKTLIY